MKNLRGELLISRKSLTLTNEDFINDSIESSQEENGGTGSNGRGTVSGNRKGIRSSEQLRNDIRNAEQVADTIGERFKRRVQEEYKKVRG